MKDADKEEIKIAAPDVTSEETAGKGKTIAKNTVYMYTRTLVMMLVTLYTSRIAIRTLGDANFGLFNLVAGIVVYFGFLNYAMERASLRFLLVEKGVGNNASMLKVFNISLSSHMLIALLVIVVGETLGLWVVNSVLNIPADSMAAANLVYQMSLVTTVFNVIRVPYNASIVAYEKMSFYAWFSIVEAVLRLGAVYLTTLIPFGFRLQGYSILWTSVTVIVFLVYKMFCTHSFDTCKFRWLWEKAKFIEMIKFSGWNLLGAVGNVSAQQGLPIILNIFFGVVINAAVAITYQVGQAVNNIISSFQTAFNPYIIKTYARGEMDKFRSSLTDTSKYSLYLVSFLVVPLILNMNFILSLWLGEEVPKYTMQFCNIYLLFYVVDAMSASLWMANQATGKVAIYNVVWTVLLLSNLPLAWVCLKFGMPVTSAFWIRVIINVVIHAFRIVYMHYQVGLEIWKYVISSIVRPFIIIGIAVPVPYLISMVTNGWIALALTTVSAFLLLAGLIWLLGLNKNERLFVKGMIGKRLG